jgi:hypothetical protein
MLVLRCTTYILLLKEAEVILSFVVLRRHNYVIAENVGTL